MDTYTLLIWEEIPEDTHLWLIPNRLITEEDRAVLRMCHNRFINHVDVSPEETAAINCLSSALCSREDCLSDEHPVGSKWAMCWADFEVKDMIEDKAITHVYMSGWIM